MAPLCSNLSINYKTPHPCPLPQVYATPGVKPSGDDLANIVQCAGGSVSGPPAAKDRNTALVLTTQDEEDGDECKKFKKQGIKLYSVEALLSSVLCQRNRTEEFRL